MNKVISVRTYVGMNECKYQCYMHTVSYVCVYTQCTRSVYLYNYAKSAISDHVKKAVKVSAYVDALIWHE